MKMFKKILNIIIDVVVVLILIVSVMVVALSFTSKSSGVPNIFGVAPLSVLSDSMKDTFQQGDLIFCNVAKDSTEKYEVGDVVSFPIEINGEVALNTHRIVEVIKDDNITYYQTQGDNRVTNTEPDEELQTSSTIVAKYSGVKIAGLGNFLTFIRTQLGFFLCILLPMIIFFIYEGVRVIMNIIAYNKEKAVDEAKAAVNNAELTEEQKQKAIEEYLASIGQTKENEPTVQTPAEGNNSDNE